MVAHAREKNRFDRKPCSIVWIIILLIASWMSVTLSVLYIADVWFPGDDDFGGVIFIITVPTVWAMFTVLLHVFCVTITKRQRAKNKTFRFNSQIFQQKLMPTKLGERTNKTIQPLSASLKKDDSSGSGNDKIPPSQLPEESPIKEMEEDPHQALGVAEPEGPTGEIPLNDVDDDEEEHDDDDDAEEVTQGNINVLEGDDVPSYCELFLAKLYQTHPYCCCCLSKYAQRHVPEPRLSFMKPVEEGWMWKTWVVFKHLLWYVLSGFLLYMTIVNIGATAQQNAARTALGPAWEFLYP
jgi:hypothetical protein